MDFSNYLVTPLPNNFTRERKIIHTRQRVNDHDIPKHSGDET